MNLGEDDDVLVRCREYRSLKQGKEWEYTCKCLQSIGHVYTTNRFSMWSVLNATDRENKVANEYSDEEFYISFKELSDHGSVVCVDDSYKLEARTFLENYYVTGSTSFDFK